MSILGEHHVSVSIDRAPDAPLRLEASALTIRMDEEWVPYVQAEVVCPLGDGDVTRIDPQTSDVWVTNTVRRTFGRIDRISDLTRRYRGKTIAALTERFRGQTVEAVTDSLYHDFTNPGAPRRAETRPWRLLLREVSVDRKAGTVAMTLASGEARLGDWTHLSDTPLRVVGQTMVDKLENVLRLAGFTGGIDFTSGPNPTDSEIGEEAVLVPGATALEYVTALTRHHGLMLWCDEMGLWHLAADRTLPNVRKLESFGPARSITDELSTRSRDDGWVTAVMVVYTWENVDHYDIYPPAGPTRRPGQTLVLKFARPYPGPGRAESTYRQVVNRGRSLELDAVSVYLINPGQSVEYTSPREVVRGRLAAIRWQFPDDAMSIRLREVGVA